MLAESAATARYSVNSAAAAATAATILLLLLLPLLLLSLLQLLLLLLLVLLLLLLFSIKAEVLISNAAQQSNTVPCWLAVLISHSS
jgi:hypothetical protein